MSKDLCFEYQVNDLKFSFTSIFENNEENNDILVMLF